MKCKKKLHQNKILSGVFRLSAENIKNHFFMSGMITRARAFSTEVLKVVNNVAKQQFMVSIQGADAVLEYDKSGKNITFIHTNVPKEFQGKGVGKILAKYAFDYAVDNKLDVTCKCHFLAHYLESNQSKYKNLKVKLELE